MGVWVCRACAFAAQPANAPSASHPFTFASVVRLARERAAHPYRNRSPRLPASLAHLTYNQYQQIQFRARDALWRHHSLFEVQFFHRGYQFNRRVEIDQVVHGVAQPIEYHRQWFDFGKLGARLAHLPADLGFAGFRVHFPLQTPNYKDELVAFLGGTYFRVLGRNQVYGLFARGLAINTAQARGREFPWFTHFWLVKPQAHERILTIYALLDSPSIAGAYQFQIEPGAISRVWVTEELFPRRRITKLGIAPLTSMFLYGVDPAGHRFDDYRPQVHDSDGLLMQTGTGEWLWRPLSNPRQLEVNRFMDHNPRGFGLIQRDRRFRDYEDSSAQFERRPSYFVQPIGKWGPGGVELVEIPTNEDIHNNIIAYWVPKDAAVPGKPLKFHYLLSAYLSSPFWPPLGRVVATRTGGFRARARAQREVMIDFGGGALAGLADVQPVKAEVSARGGHVRRVSVYRLAQNGDWRVTFDVAADNPGRRVDLSCRLTLYGAVLTETWTDQLSVRG